VKTEYKILINESYETLEATVNQYLKIGWNLVGGIAINKCENDDWENILFAQAIDKCTCEEEE
jgi:hypothetical protein